MSRRFFRKMISTSMISYLAMTGAATLVWQGELNAGTSIVWKTAPVDALADKVAADKAKTAATEAQDKARRAQAEAENAQVEAVNAQATANRTKTNADKVTANLAAARAAKAKEDAYRAKDDALRAEAVSTRAQAAAEKSAAALSAAEKANLAQAAADKAAADRCQWIKYYGRLEAPVPAVPAVPKPTPTTAIANVCAQSNITTYDNKRRECKGADRCHAEWTLRFAPCDEWANSRLNRSPTLSPGACGTNPSMSTNPTDDPQYNTCVNSVNRQCDVDYNNSLANCKNNSNTEVTNYNNQMQQYQQYQQYTASPSYVEYQKKLVVYTRYGYPNGITYEECIRR